MHEPSPFRSQLDAAFDGALGRLLADPAPLTVLFSGGVDSSMLALGLRSHPALELLTVGSVGCADLRNARESAALLGLSWRSAIVGEAEVRSVLQRTERHLVGSTPTSRAVAVSLAAAFVESRSPRLVAGQGVDELFLGYAHFRHRSGPELERRYREDLRALSEREWPRAQTIARSMGHEVLAPFLDPELRAACEQLPLSVRAPGEETKPWFRAWAQSRGVPSVVAHRPKKALQFGSGIDRILRKVLSGEPHPMRGSPAPP